MNRARRPGPTGPANGPLRPFAAVIFDLDGVLVDSEPLHERACRDLFAELGYGATPAIHFPDYFGRADRDLWQDFAARHQPPQTVDELVARKQARFLALLRAHRPIFPEVPGLVKRLAARFPLAIASGSPHAVIGATLALRHLGRFFPVRVSASDVPRGKPAPDIFLRAAERLGTPPEVCVVVEDAPAGVAGARAAGMQVVALAQRVPAARLAGATCVVWSHDELERVLLPTAR